MKHRIISTTLVSGKLRKPGIRFPAHGGFREFTVLINVSHTQKGVGSRWLVRSSGRRSTVVNFLFLKWLWDELSSQELKFMFNLPEFFKDPRFESSFRARAYGTPKKEIRERLNKYLSLIGEHPFDYERYRGMRGLFLLLELQEFYFPPTPKFSGYTRHHKDKGSLRSRSEDPLELFTFEEKVDRFEFWFHLLSVGEVRSTIRNVYLFPEESSKKKRNRHAIISTSEEHPL